MKISNAKLVVSVVGFYILAIAELVGFVGFSEHSYATAQNQAQRQYSDLQKDEISLARDIKLLRRSLYRGGNEASVAKERHSVREDLLNIRLERMPSAEGSQDLDRDQVLASVIGEAFAGPARESSLDLEPASRG